MDLLGRFRLFEKMASTGTSEIYRAEDSREGHEPVILKKLKRELVYDSQFIGLLRSEFETLSQLNHPNIVSVLDFQSVGEDHYLVLEFVGEWTLRKLLDSLPEKKAPVPIAVELAQQIAAGLASIHDTLGIVHSDLNPRNILISPSGLVKLIDFSIAQAEENKVGSKKGVGRGIMGYMSPEQTRSEGIDERSDIFSLGVLLYEMIFGEAPFDAQSPVEVYFQMMDREITPSMLPESMDPELKAMLVRALAKRPEERYSRMIDFQESLKNYLQNNAPYFSIREIENFLRELKSGR